MKSLNKEEAELIYKVIKSINFNSFVEWLEASLLEEREASDNLESFGEMKRSQGYRCALNDILSELELLKSENETN